MASDSDHIISELFQLRYALDHLKSYVYIKNKDFTYIYANKHTLDLFGCSRAELIGKSDSDFFPTETVKKLREIDLKVLAGECTQEEVIVEHPTEGCYIYHEVKTPIFAEQNTGDVVGILGISTDITKQKKLEEQALHLAKTDALTKIPNRLMLDETLKSELNRACRYTRPLSIIIVDIDHFKQVNDCHGHLVGDKCLCAVSQIISQNIRNVDILGRWGGEEFLIICPETDLNGAKSIAEKIRLALSQQEIDNIGQLTASFGVTTSREGDTETSIIQRADFALYRAKNDGRNRVESHND